MRMTSFMTGLGLVMVLTLVGCGGDGGSAKTSSAAGRAPAGFADTLSAMEKAAKANQGPDDGLVAKYKVVNDPNAFYTLDDLPQQGNFLKLNFEGIDPDVLNRIIHRFKTEATVCGAEHGAKVEAVLAAKPECAITLRVAKNISREEKMKAARGLD